MALRVNGWEDPEPDDRALVEAYRAGSVAAFEAIVEKNASRLQAQARRRLGSSSEAEDAVQETFERALRAMDRFGHHGDFRMSAWLARILANVCHDRSAHLASERRASDRAVLAASPAPDVGTIAAGRQLSPELLRALDELPATHRRALWLRVVEDMDYSEVARWTGTSEDNARARVHRARRALRRRLDAVGSALGVAIGPVALRLGRRSRHGMSSHAALGAPGDAVTQVVAQPWTQAVLTSVGSSRGTALVGAFTAVVTLSAGGLAAGGATGVGRSHSPVVLASAPAPTAVADPPPAPPPPPTVPLAPTAAAAAPLALAAPALPKLTLLTRASNAVDAVGTSVAGVGAKAGDALLSPAAVPALDAPTLPVAPDPSTPSPAKPSPPKAPVPVASPPGPPVPPTPGQDWVQQAERSGAGWQDPPPPDAGTTAGCPDRGAGITPPGAPAPTISTMDTGDLPLLSPHPGVVALQATTDLVAADGSFRQPTTLSGQACVTSGSAELVLNVTPMDARPFVAFATPAGTSGDGAWLFRGTTSWPPGWVTWLPMTTNFVAQLTVDRSRGTVHLRLAFIGAAPGG